MADDFSGDTSTIGTVAVGGSQTGNIETGFDTDWFAVTLVAGQVYVFDIEGADTGGGTLSDPTLKLYYSFGAPRDSRDGLLGEDGNGGTGLNSQITYRAGVSGTHYISAGGAGSSTGTYTVSAANLPDDFADDTTTTGTVVVGGSQTGVINYEGDADWFKVTLELGKVYTIDLEGSATGAGTLGIPAIAGIYLGSIAPLSGVFFEDTGNANFRATFIPSRGDTYYISATGGLHTGTGSYRLSVSETFDDYGPYHSNYDLTSAGAVVVGGSATGVINYNGDIDAFGVSLTAGTIYRIDVEGADTGGGTLKDPLVNFFSTSGEFPALGIVSTGLNARVFLTWPLTETVYVMVGAGVGLTGRGTSGSYTVSVTEVIDDYAADASTTGVVAVGGSQTGVIDYYGALSVDIDWFSVSLVAGQSYVFDLEGAETGRGTLGDTLLSVADSSLAVVAGSIDNLLVGKDNSQLIYTATNSGTYYAAVRPEMSTVRNANGFWNFERDAVGSYTLSVAQLADDFRADVATTGTVAVGGSQTGAVEFIGDTDWIAVSLTAGETYYVDLEGAATGAGTLANPKVYGIYDSSGTLIENTAVDDGGAGLNSRQSFTAATTGTYYISSADSAAYYQGSYTLSVTLRVDDYVDDISTTATVDVGGARTGVINESEDLDFFKVSLTAGQTYTIDLEGADTDRGTLSNPEVRVYGTYDGGRGSTLVKLLGFDRDSGTGLNASLSFTPDDTAIYYISAIGTSGTTGSYVLSVTGPGGSNVRLGTPGPDTLSGDGNDNQLFGLAGDDELFGNGGNDALYGGAASAAPLVSEVAGPVAFSAAVGDFDSDGEQDDILWLRGTDGQAYLWEMDDSTKSSGATMADSLGVTWTLLGVGDFDGDGMVDDILWHRSTDGQTQLWEMQNGAVVGGGVVQVSTSLLWKVIGIGDFDGDGKDDDVLWYRNSDGRIYIREMEDGAVVQGHLVKTSTNLEWDLAGIGDFDGDGKVDDVLWYRNTDGRVYIRDMENHQITKGYLVKETTNLEWEISGVGDFDGDGKVDDVLWYRVSDGRTYIRQMENHQIISGNLLKDSFDTDWQLVNIGDFDGDGEINDILWRNTTTGDVEIWNIENSRLVGSKDGAAGPVGLGDLLTGGPGDDLFVFEPGTGKNTITDFTAGAATDDEIDLAAFNFADFAAVQAATTDAGANTVIDLAPGDNITLIDVLLADLHQDDFLLA